MARAIETCYGGYRFRSRLEARWAVFFDSMGVRWQYEVEGFELKSGRYLPDFLLPDLNLWVEIKGEQPTEHELSLGEELANETNRPVVICSGLPGGEVRVYCSDTTDSGTGGTMWWDAEVGEATPIQWAIGRESLGIFIDWSNHCFLTPEWDDCPCLFSCTSEVKRWLTEADFAAATSARFEFSR